MSANVHAALYRRLVALYPREFRDEYREDLAATFATQLIDDGALRCWLRTARDLIVTLPSQHLESRMHRSSSSRVAMIALALAVGFTVAAVALGGSLYAVILLVVAMAGLVVATMSWRAAQPAIVIGSSDSWKKFLAAGIGLLAFMVVLMNVPSLQDQDLSPVAWSLTMRTPVLSIVLIGTGVTLGLARLTKNRAAAK
jgi:hypothetical protein